MVSNRSIDSAEITSLKTCNNAHHLQRTIVHGYKRIDKMELLEDLLYSETHEWVRNQGNLATIGLTDFAQGQLKDIIYLELPEIGSEFKEGESIGVIESVKTVTDLLSPISGKVIETNLSLKDHPQYINEDPYGKGWIAIIEIKNIEELKKLLSYKTYQSSFLNR